MKIFLKKVLIILIMFTIVFEFSFSNISFADSQSEMQKNVNMISNLTGGLVSIVLWRQRILITLLALAVNQALGALAGAAGTIDTSKTNSEKEQDGTLFLTPFDIFFNEYPVLKINFFNVTEAGTDDSNFVYKFRSTVAYWFYALRTIASAMLLVILIYVGIRMALSSIADDRAKYKKMLIDWVCSLLLIFLLQYMAIGIIYLNNSIVDALKTALADTGVVKDIMLEFFTKSVAGAGITSLVATFVFCGITAQSAFYFIAYLKRVIKIGFLIIISPLISITYSIDKMGDGKAQALNNWLKEFIYTILIQPFHCIIYIAFINTAFKLVKETTLIDIGSLRGMNQLATGVLVIMCLKFIDDAEKVVRKIFGFSDGNGKTAMAVGAVMAGTAVKNARKLGSVSRNGINSFSKYGKDLKTAISTDASKFMNYGPGKKIGEKLSSKLPKSSGEGILEKFKGDASSIANSAKQSSAFKTLNKGINGAKSLKGKFSSHEKVQKIKSFWENNKKNIKNGIRADTAKALGFMAMAMSYSTGQTDLLSANAYRTAVQDGASEFFNTSKNSIAESVSEDNRQIDKAEYEEIESGLNEAKEKLKSAGLNENATAEDVDNLSADSNINDRLNKAKEKAKARKTEQEKLERKLKEQQEKLENAKMAKAKPKASKSERRAAQANIDKAEKEIKNISQAKSNIDKKVEEANQDLKDIQEEADKYDELKNAIAKRDFLQSKKDNFYTEAAKQERIRARQFGPSKSEINKKKNEILKLIMDLKRDQNTVSESSQSNLLTEEETDNASRMAEHITNAVDLSLLKGASFFGKSDSKDEYSKKILEGIGITNDNSEIYQSLNKAVQEYALLGKRTRVANAFAQHESYSGDSDLLANAMVKNLDDYYTGNSASSGT